MLQRLVRPFVIDKRVNDTSGDVTVSVQAMVSKSMRIHDVSMFLLLNLLVAMVWPQPPPEDVNRELGYEGEGVLAHQEKKGRGRQVKRECL